MVRGARHTQREPLARDLIGPRRLVIGVQQDVRMPFDQTRRQRRARQVDDGGARRRDACVGSDGVDALAFHAHAPSLARRLAVEDARGTQDDDRRVDGRLPALRRHTRGDGEDGDGESEISHARIIVKRRLGDGWWVMGDGWCVLKVPGAGC